MEQQETGFFETSLDETSKAYLLETVRWTKFLAILTFIMIGFMVLGALFLIFGMGAMMSNGMNMGAMGGFGAAGLGTGYLILIGLYIYPVLCLYRFGTNIKAGIQSNNQLLINEGFRYQKNMYRFIGILTIIVLALYLLAIIFGGIGSMMG